MNMYPEGPSTQCLRTLGPKTIKSMVFETRSLKYWVLGPSRVDIFIHICMCIPLYIYICVCFLHMSTHLYMYKHMFRYEHIYVQM